MEDACRSSRRDASSPVPAKRALWGFQPRRARLLGALVAVALLVVAWPTASSAIEERWTRDVLTYEVKKLKKQNRRQGVQISELRTSLSDWGQVMVGLDLAAREREAQLIKCIRKRERRESACLRRIG